MISAQSSPHTRRRKIKSQIFGFFCFLAAAVAMLLLATLLWKILADGLGRLSWEFLRNPPSEVRPTRAGIWPAIAGSLMVMGLTAIITVPVGVAAAVYLEEFTTRKNRFTTFIEVNIANLSGVPSIVYGMLGLAVFVTWLNLGKGVLTGALTMSLLILPMVILVAREALRAVPRSYREGSMALGATPWQCIWTAALPNALPGILTGIILALSRAIGETAPLIVVGAAGLVTSTSYGLQDPYMALPLQIFNWAGRPQESFHDAAAAAIIVLMGALLLLNSAAIIIRSRAQKKQRA